MSTNTDDHDDITGTDSIDESAPLLEVSNLCTYFDTDQGVVKAVDGVSLTVERGETVAIVGESGSGKTVTSESITQLFKQPPGYIADGSVAIDGNEVTHRSEDELGQIRGRTVGHIFQNPQGALNPVYTVGWQIREAIQLHRDVTDEEATELTVELLTQVGIPEASSRLDDYPHELSGGMKQRVIIAMALACDPDLLIADEPTTALDVTIQAQILELLNRLQEKRDMGLLFITHDLGVVANIADRVVVMYAGKVMERGPVEAVFESPSHPYTKALLECLPGEGTLGGIPGELPDPRSPPGGCRFASRCEYTLEECHQGGQPSMAAVDGDDHQVSCVHYRPEMDSSVVRDAPPEEQLTDDVSADGGKRR
ncbi:ABC transporter ATP-binding protein [Natronobacterium gregoryi]|uniref:Nickel import system ATP-binding protein NikD n=2 Tax=Natronobacterium gregoryi TaxID=44930 RepID=L0AG56_NATGS|nr:ABC transporter ATP-binding protein [Natronobacterium gregoryi]AFZ72050.1 oligopeptide/dipeptide ABC transporter, ATP-binding protein [Natronobacterium gregoryi SP2]ELY62778.1 peptide ABC transporter ATPase [Natronobacterium gregoryi SP2]PLK20898.1 ABC transporter ATP-binding protein [Natronobacterium gregoryi SP2]SFJ44989.1 peptide/nickel transport system ATP-binding protein [Natronobacterium gregoryi]